MLHCKCASQTCNSWTNLLTKANIVGQLVLRGNQESAGGLPLGRGKLGAELFEGNGLRSRRLVKSRVGRPLYVHRLPK